MSHSHAYDINLCFPKIRIRFQDAILKTYLQHVYMILKTFHKIYRWFCDRSPNGAAIDFRSARIYEKYFAIRDCSFDFLYLKKSSYFHVCVNMRARVNHKIKEWKDRQLEGTKSYTWINTNRPIIYLLSYIVAQISQRVFSVLVFRSIQTELTLLYPTLTDFNRNCDLLFIFLPILHIYVSFIFKF